MLEGFSRIGQISSFAGSRVQKFETLCFANTTLAHPAKEGMPRELLHVLEHIDE